MEYADSTVMSRANPGVHVMVGNVKFSHKGAVMTCDSAYLYEIENSLDAFSNVTINQGDSVFLYGGFLRYDGNLNEAKMWENVRMENATMTLFTEDLVFDRNRNLAYYFDHGTLVDENNELVSVYGEYSPSTKLATFRDQVVLTNYNESESESENEIENKNDSINANDSTSEHGPVNFVLTTNVLEYSTIDKVATILGKTKIVSDSAIIYSTRGKYDTANDLATLYDRSLVVSKDETKTMTGDTLFFNRATGFGEAFGHMVLNDTVQKVILMGNYGYFDRQRDFAFATDSAQAIEYGQKDSLFLHADTLQIETVTGNRLSDTGDLADTLHMETGTAKVERELKAFYGVRIYRVDLQGVCDSLQFNTVDSTLYLYKNPILWNTGYQITGDKMEILFNDSTLERMNVFDRAFAMEEKDSTYFNQVKGKDIHAFFTGGELTQVDVTGSTESIYYPVEDSGTEFIGRNKSASDYMTLFIENRKPWKIVWFPATQGEMLPLVDLVPASKFLDGFYNYNYLRPLDRTDIFRKTVFKSEDIPAPKRHQKR
jgi:lipopolysaccharide export system protein LptA